MAKRFTWAARAKPAERSTPTADRLGLDGQGRDLQSFSPGGLNAARGARGRRGDQPWGHGKVRRGGVWRNGREGGIRKTRSGTQCLHACVRELGWVAAI